jgi:hypothetical protein
MVSELSSTNVAMSDFSTQSSVSPSTLPTIAPMPNFSYVKLGRDNYLTWKQQLLPYLQGHDVYGYIDGSVPPPPKLVSSASTSNDGLSPLAPNPDYKRWFQQDQLLLSTILSSLTENVLAQMIGYSISREVWMALERMYTSQSRARTLQMRTHLATLRKGNASISEYFQRVKSLCDTLAAAGQPLSDDESISYILAGLGSDFDPFVTSVTTRLDPMTIEELYNHLLTHEMRIDHQNQSSGLLTASAHVASRQSFKGRPQRPHQSYRGGGSTRGSFFSSRGGTHPRYSSGSSRPQCQICGKLGHTALKCFRRFDVAHQMDVPSATSSQALAAFSQPSPSNSDWHPDTGATHHITADMKNLTLNNEEYHGSDNIQVGNGTGLAISHMGSSTLNASNHSFSLKNILLVPEIQKNLLSVQQFAQDNNVYFIFHANFFLIKDCTTRTTLHRGPLRNGLYSMQFSSRSSSPWALIGVRVSFEDWHKRLGHPAFPTVSKIVGRFCLPVSTKSRPSVCSECQQAKSHALPFPLSMSKSRGPLDLIFSHVWGPSPVLSTHGSRYYLVFVDDYSKYMWLFPLLLKSDVESSFYKFQALVERQFNRKIKAIQSDWGGEFRRLNVYFKNHGIIHRLACPHTHQQNGSVERRHRHITEMGLALLAHSHLPHSYWEEAFTTATYLINRLPTPVLQNRSPFETLFQKSPDYTFLRVFGCACWPCLRPYNCHKLDYRSKTCIFLGYSTEHHGYKCLDQFSGRVYVSRNVIFNEQLFPFSSGSPNSDSSLPSHVHLSTPNTILQEPAVPLSSYAPHVPSISQASPSRRVHHPTAPQLPSTAPTSTRVAPTSPLINTSSTRVPLSSHENSLGAPINDDEAHIYPTPPDLAAPHDQVAPLHTSSIRVPLPAPPLGAPITVAEDHASHPMVTRARNNVFKPKQFLDGTVRYPLPKALLAEHSALSHEPSCYTEAVKHSHWREAMNVEFDALMRNGTWSLVPSTPNQNIIGCKWVFRIKRKADGSIERYKARLVAKGYHQQPGIDFYETYSPVIKPTTIRTVLSIAVALGWCLRQIDIQNAFLHGFLNEEVFMAQPPGFCHPQLPHHVCHLRKALYGLKQAPRAWFSRLSNRLLALGFTGSKADSSLFIFRQGSVVIYFLIYVDDILVTGSNLAAVNSVIQQLNIDFAVKDLGHLSFFSWGGSLTCLRWPLSHSKKIHC